MPAAIPILVGVSVAGTAASIYSSEKARKQQKKANQARERIRQTQSARERLSQVREARIAQARIIQGGASMEGSSSTVDGAYSAVGSSAAGNIQFINQMDNLQQEVFNRMAKANLYGAQSGYYSAASNLAMQGASLASMGAPTKPTPTASSGSGYTTPGGMSGANYSAVVNRNDPLSLPPMVAPKF